MKVQKKEKDFSVAVFYRIASFFALATLLAPDRVSYGLQGKGSKNFKEALCSKNCMKNAA